MEHLMIKLEDLKDKLQEIMMNGFCMSDPAATIETIENKIKKIQDKK